MSRMAELDHALETARRIDADRSNTEDTNMTKQSHTPTPGLTRYVISRAGRFWNSRSKTWVTEQDGSYSTYMSYGRAMRACGQDQTLKLWDKVELRAE